MTEDCPFCGELMKFAESGDPLILDKQYCDNRDCKQYLRIYELKESCGFKRKGGLISGRMLEMLRNDWG